MRIELVGGLGIGKSTLCKSLQTLGFNCIYENLKTNPFLADCFIDPAAFRFPSQMWFVLSKYHEIVKFEKPGRVNVLDQSVLNVKAYTYMLFEDHAPEALAIIEQCFDYMANQTGEPDLLINMKCSPAEQMRRIRGRNRDHEKAVTLEYIRGLQNHIDNLVESARANGQAVIDIDTEKVYLPDNIDYVEKLTARLGMMFDVDMTQYLSPVAANESQNHLQRVDEHALVAAE